MSQSDGYFFPLSMTSVQVATLLGFGWTAERCNRRWNRYLKDVKRPEESKRVSAASPWTSDEDEMLRAIVLQHGTHNWNHVSRIPYLDDALLFLPLQTKGTEQILFHYTKLINLGNSTFRGRADRRAVQRAVASALEEG